MLLDPNYLLLPSRQFLRRMLRVLMLHLTPLLFHL